MPTNRHALLLTLLSLDPDGQAAEPTDAKRDAFRAWVIDTHGKSLWDTYVGSWTYA